MRRLAPLFLLPLIFLLAPISPVLAAGTASIDGAIQDKTEGATLQGGAKAYLYLAADKQDPKQVAETAVDPQGHFHFGNLATDPGNVYRVGVEYAGAPYFTDPIAFGPGEIRRQIEVSVYEPTADDKLLSIAATNLVVTDPDASAHVLPVLELDAFVNGSSRTFIPSTQPRNGGPPNLLRFSLPPNATNLQAGSGLAQDDLIQISGGFGALAPLPPGQNEIGFTFQAPYQESSFVFDKSILYPTKSLRVLIPSGKFQLDSPQLARQAPATIGGKSYEVLTAANLAPGSRVELRFSRLPGISPLAFLSRPQTLVWLAGALAAIVLGLLAWYLNDRRRRRVVGAAEPTPVSGRHDLELEQRDLLIEMARLDDRYDAGSISAEDYRAQRDARKEELRQIMRRLETAEA